MKITEVKFGCLIKKEVAEIHTRKLPKLQDDQVLMKMKACNICTTDYGQWLGLREHQGYPMAGGHEACGEIVEKGKNVENFEIGDLVSFGYDGCGICDFCKKGLFGFSNYTTRSIRGLYKVSVTLNPSEAGFLEPIATVLHGMNKLRVNPYDLVVVIGAGTMGLINAQVARSYGCKVILTELMPNKIETAKKMGFTVIDASKKDPVKEVINLSNGKGVDAVIVAVGNAEANDQAIQMLKYRDGKVLFFSAGYPSPKNKLDSNLIHYRRIVSVKQSTSINKSS